MAEKFYGNVFQLAALFLAFNCFASLGHGAATLAPDEVEALRQIGRTLGKKDWDFSVDPCSQNSGWVTAYPPSPTGLANNVSCNCSYQDNTVCHVTSIALKAQNLSGVLPPELVKLPFLQAIDLTRNFLNGTLPRGWASLPLVSIALVGNRLSGPIPNEFGNISTLKNLTIEANQFSEHLPLELGSLVNLERLHLSSNKFTGDLPTTLAKLTNLKEFRISDNNFTGTIPSFIQNWSRLENIAMQASGLQGPIPSSISSLTNLTDMRISDMNGSTLDFPPLSMMKNMKTLILRNCNLTGNIPDFVGSWSDLKILDLSFNKLRGPIPGTFSKFPKYMYLTNNLLTGLPPGLTQMKQTNIDLSYNNVSSESCSRGTVNLFGSFSNENNSVLTIPCLKNSTCDQYRSTLHINCGGDKVTVNDTKFEADSQSGGPSTYWNSGNNWGFSSTGTFLDDSIEIDTYIFAAATNEFSLYKTARLSPLSLTYYGSCMLNGNYTVSLHFAEIMFRNDSTYYSLGRRIFDVYIQGKLMLKDFNIEDAAGGAEKPNVQTFPAIVSNNALEIRLIWAGKGTTALPVRGTYGPLISAISAVNPTALKGGKKIPMRAIVGIVIGALCFILLFLGILWWKGCLFGKPTVDQDLRRLELQTGSFTLRQIRAATNNFDVANKIGEGGFGPVYKGLLSDGTIIAVKQLSSKSQQGNREFVNEIGMISALQHPNLVKLYGCCVEGNQLLLIYEYLENNSLARALWGSGSRLKLDWQTRHRICIGIARGLAYLHEESRLKIVHRDIKTTNVLLDKDLNPKISDFGLAKLHEQDQTHISTRIAGTYGYMAPEYAMRGHLTDKADVYSFGIVAIEIVSGKCNMQHRPKEKSAYLLDWVYELKERGTLLELIDPNLGSDFNEAEAMGMINVALQCTNSSPTLRPAMSTVVSLLEGRTVVQEVVSNPSVCDESLGFEAMTNQSESYSHTKSMCADGPWTAGSISGSDLYPVALDSNFWSNRN